jgi:hypothetical protein
MPLPVRWGKVHLHVADNTPASGANLKDCVPEIRSWPEIPFAWVQDAQFRAVTRDEAVRPQVAVIPHGLHVPLGKRLGKPAIASSRRIFTSFHACCLLSFNRRRHYDIYGEKMYYKGITFPLHFCNVALSHQGQALSC